MKSASPPFVPPPGKTSKKPYAWEVGNITSIFKEFTTECVSTCNLIVNDKLQLFI